MRESILQGMMSGDRLFLMAGTCVVESRELTYEVAESLVRVCEKLNIPLIYKGSYRKANRSRLDSFTGIGDLKALKILSEVREEFGVPIVTDIHESAEAEWVAEFADVLQIPAFLSRQTDLIVAAAKTGKVVNIKKGQFLSPEVMQYAVEKVVKSGNNQVILTERGTTFGYGDLIIDYRSIPKMKALGYPVVMDVTHALQHPNTASGVTGGEPAMIDAITSAAVAVGVDGLFIETHPHPDKALSDGANMLPLSEIESLLKKAIRIREAIKE